MQVKKQYQAPRLNQHGNFTTLTQQGGSSSVDVPIGSPVGPSGISSVAS